MKNIKAISLITFITFVSIFSYKYLKQDNVEPGPVTEWKTYKKESGKVVSHASTEEELKTSKVLQKSSRSPASKKLDKNKRIITGTQVEEYKKRDKTIRYLNSPAKDWQDKFAKRKLLTLKQGTKVLIKHKQSILKVTNDGAKYLEKVTVSILKEDGLPRSYEALINSETGHQVSAWNRTHHENVDRVIFSKKL